MRISAANSLWIVLLILLGASACSGRKKITDISAAGSRDLHTVLTRGPYDWTWFSASGNMKMDSPFFSGSGQYSLRMKEDSLVWMAIRFLGMEVARMQADPDSVILLNRWDRTVDVYTWQELAAFTGFPTSLVSLQRLILGWLPILPAHIHVEEESGDFRKVRAIRDHLHMFVRMEGEDLHLTECRIRDTGNGAEILGKQEAWSTLHGLPFSFVRQWEMTPEPNNRVFLQVQIQDGTFTGPLSFPFDIPARYSRGD